MNTSRTAMRGEAITAWNRWGHKRPRAWLVKYGGLYVPEWHVIRDFQREAKEATKGTVEKTDKIVR